MNKVTFDREERYTVIKHKDLNVDDRAELDQLIQSRHIPTRKCLVIESDWPEYEPAWRMIEARVTGATPQPSAVPDAITMADVMRAWEYAEDHPHKYLRGTTNWCAAMAHSLNQRNPSAPTVQGDEAGETRRVCHACATWSRTKACPVCDPQMSHMTLQLLEALEGLVSVNEQHNAAIQRVTGTPAGWKDDYLNQARAAIAAAREGE